MIPNSTWRPPADLALFADDVVKRHRPHAHVVRWPVDLAKKAARDKRYAAAIHHDRAESLAATAKAKGALTEALKRTGVSIKAQVRAALEAHKFAKADDPTPDQEAAAASILAGEIADKLDLASLDFSIDDVEEALFDIYSDAARKAYAMVGVKVEGDLVNQINVRAVAFSQARSAELIGMRWVNGNLIDDPTGVWAISETTRAAVRDKVSTGLKDNIGTPAIADSIETIMVGGQPAFGPERAGVIARTEVANANEQSKLDAWRGSQTILGVKLLKSWLTSGNDNVCPECEDNEADGAIALDADFSSGDDAPLAHPNCACVLIVEPDDEGGGDDDVQG